MAKQLNPTFDNGVENVKGPPLADKAIAPSTPSTKDILQEWGGTGTIIVGGILSNVDYNNELTGVQRVLIYDEMLKGDGTVRAASIAVKLPIKAANWYIKEASQDPDDIMKRDFIKEQLFNSMAIRWNDWLNQCLKHLDYGSMVFEKVYKIIDDGQFKGKIGWEKFAPRLTKTIYRWRMPDNVTEGITQILPTGGIRGIPIWKLLVFVNEQEGENYEGISLFRAAYKHWYMKEAYYKIDGIATERQGLGIPYVKIPPNATDRDRALVDEILRNMRANEASNVQVPVGWEIGFLDMKSGGTKNSKDMIMHHDRQIVKSVLAQFIELGSGSTGSFALSSDQSELFLLSLKSIANNIQEILNTAAIRELIDLNFPNPNGKYPTLEYSRIGTVDFEKLSVALFRLAQGGLISATPEIEQYLLNVMDLPEAATGSADEEENPEDVKITIPKPGDLPTKNKSQNMNQKLTAREMDRLETKLAGELREVSRTIGMDVRELRRNIQEAINDKTI